jgi:hypothetical protein
MNHFVVDHSYLRSLRLNRPKGTAIAVPLFVPFVLFVVKSFSVGGVGRGRGNGVRE